VYACAAGLARRSADGCSWRSFERVLGLLLSKLSIPTGVAGCPAHAASHLSASLFTPAPGNVGSIIEAGAGGGNIGEWLRETLVTGIGVVGTGVPDAAWVVGGAGDVLGLTPQPVAQTAPGPWWRGCAVNERVRRTARINNGGSAAAQRPDHRRNVMAGEPHKRMRPQVPANAPAHILGDSPAGRLGRCIGRHPCRKWCGSCQD